MTTQTFKTPNWRLWVCLLLLLIIVALVVYINHLRAEAKTLELQQDNKVQEQIRQRSKEIQDSLNADFEKKVKTHVDQLKRLGGNPKIIRVEVSESVSENLEILNE